MEKETKRYISAGVGLILLGLVIFFIDTVVLDIVLTLIGIVAVYESVNASCKKNVWQYEILCIAFVIAKLLFQVNDEAIIILLVFALFCVAMASKGRLRFKDMAAVLLLTVLISYGIFSVIKLRDFGNNIADKRVLVIFGFGFGWLGDSMAYTFGKAFGKRKLSPRISPNKTVFGAVSGVLITTIASVILFGVYSNKCSSDSLFYGKYNILNCVVVSVVGFIGSIIGVLGDLALSYVKRQTGIKDFGNIMPGHGGAIDRIDNILFTSTYAYFVFSLLL